MSFQDVGRNKSQRQPQQATFSNNNNGMNGGTNTNRIGGFMTTTTSTSTTTAASSVSAPVSAPAPFGSAWGSSLSFPMAAATGTTTTTDNAMSQISNSLTQYQRNVGILEKIAIALLQRSNHPTHATLTQNLETRIELETQYKAQCDVLRQLEQRLKEQMLAQRQRLIDNNSNNNNATTTSSEKSVQQKQALLKLERDFERVQGSVQVTKSKVAKQMKQYQQQQQQQQRGSTSSFLLDPNSTNNNDHTTTIANMLQQQHQQQQLQLQQDRLQEEIMREREEEIRKINQGMHQVHEIYKDLAHIVGEQQEQVDTIETQMEDARNTAQSGLDQVHQANEKYGNQQCVIS